MIITKALNASTGPPMLKHWGVKKYLLIVKNTWDEVFTYRLNFVMWRVRVILQILTLYFLWRALLPGNSSIGDYQQSQILTYILGTSIVSAFVLASRSQGIGDDINQGNLSNILIRPINYFLYWFSKDIGDKAINLLFSIVEISALILIIRPAVIIQQNQAIILLTALSIVIALIIYFLCNLLLGFIGFWSPETWAPRFLFFVVINFAAGGLFPLDILPEQIFSILKFLPFTYLLYFPLKIYLGQLSPQEITTGLLIAFVWAAILYLAAKLIWQRGLAIYTAYGR